MKPQKGIRWGRCYCGHSLANHLVSFTGRCYDRATRRWTCRDCSSS